LKPYNTSKNFGKAIIKYPKDFKIGRGSTYNDGCYFNARFGIEIGENTLLGPNILIQTSQHVIKNINIEQNANDENSWCASNPNKRIKGSKVFIGDDVWIGANVTILSGVVIPNKCIIGACSVLTESNTKKLKPGDIVINDIKLKILGNRENYE
jgi:acetyltransferase-like isoleucine patch superfamily enzyme